MKLRKPTSLFLLVLGLSALSCNLPFAGNDLEMGIDLGVESNLHEEMGLELESLIEESEVVKPVELLFFIEDTVYSYNFATMELTHVISPSRVGRISNPLLSPDNEYMAFIDDEGLHGLHLSSGEEIFFLPEISDDLEGEKYYPRDWSQNDLLLVDRWWGGGEGSFEPGWISIEDRVWHPILSLEEVTELAYACATGKSLSSSGKFIAVSGQTHGMCGGDYTLSILDRDSGLLETIRPQEIFFDQVNGNDLLVVAGGTYPVWSPNEAWIAFGMEDDAVPLSDGSSEFPTRLHLIRPDGTGLMQISTNTVGVVSTPIWVGENDLYYVLTGDSSLQDGIYKYDIQSRTNSLMVPGALNLMGISEQGEYLVYWKDGLVPISLIDHQPVNVNLQGLDQVEIQILGWRYLD